MANLKSDFSEWNAVLDNLAGPARESLARRMAVSGGRIVRDEAKQLAPDGVAEAQAVQRFGGSKNPGALKAAIYTAFADKLSNAESFTYVVSWNSRKGKAPHGHLVEFGYVQPYVIVFDAERNRWITNPQKRLRSPKIIPAQPFLRPAFEGTKQQVLNEMLETGRRELPKLLQESKK